MTDLRLQLESAKKGIMSPAVATFKEPSSEHCGAVGENLHAAEQEAHASGKLRGYSRPVHQESPIAHGCKTERKVEQ